MPDEIELKAQAKTPVTQFRRRSAIFTSTGKVRSAFKSPSRSPIAPKYKESCEELTTQVAGDSSRGANEKSDVIVTPYKRKRRQIAVFRTPTKALKHQVQPESPIDLNFSKNSKETGANFAEELEKLNKENQELEAEILLLRDQGFDESDIQVYIEKLHEYNEIKDVGQMLLGQLACRSGVTTRQLYSRFSLDLDS